MGVDVMEVGVHVKKGLIFVITNCYRSARDHPFFLGVGVFVFFLYRCFPALFAFLVSSSPVIFCTAVLLGALLSFGNPNIPEVEEVEEEEDEKGRKSHHEISALKAGVVEGDLVVEKDEGFSVEAHTEKGVVEEKDLGFSGVRDGYTSERSLVIEEEIKENHEERELQEEEFREKREFNEEKRVLEGEESGGKSGIESIQVEKPWNERELPAGTYLEDPFGVSQWKKIKNHDESSDSDSDGAESSSPDTSLADILPMLDELHPLLDSESPQPALVSHGDSDDASECSSGGSSEEEEEEEEEHREEIENHEEEEDDDEEETQQGGQDDATEPVVTWTADDEKNLMDLGNSELERNRRLESLIARRMMRKNLRTIAAEKNLIDFDGFDHPFPIAQISTVRRNPFDIHYDSNEGMGLPPIPGSAPCLLAPRRNPFDLPYEPHEERPNLSGGSFEEEFLTGHEKDMHFRRYESFHMGSSFFEEPKPNFRFRPFFTTEQASPERMSYPTFQRQMSEKSDSKMSSVTETESISSTVDHDNPKNLVEGELSQEGEPVHRIDYAPYHDKPESSSSLDVDVSDIGQEDHRDFDAVIENIHERDLTVSNTKSAANVYMEAEVVEEKHSRSSSSSSEYDQTFPERIRDEIAEDSSHSVQSSVVGSDLRDRATEGTDESHKEEPVYDWVPSEFEKTLSGITIIEEALCYADKGDLTSTSSIASDVPVGGESSMHSGGIGKETASSNEETWVASSQLCAVDQNEMRSREVTMISEENVLKAGYSGDIRNSDEFNASVVPSVEPILPNSDSTSSASESQSDYEKRISEEQHLYHEQEQISSSSSYPVHFGPPQFDMDEADGIVSDSGALSEDLMHLSSEKPPSSLVGDQKESQQDKGVNAVDISQEVLIHEHEGKDSSSPPALVSDSSSIPTKVSEYKPATDQIFLEGTSHAGIQNSGDSEDATGIQGEELDVVEEIKDIDEVLLTELDAVGDFSVEEYASNTNQLENQLVVGVQESLHELQVLEGNSSQDVEGDSHVLIKHEAVVDPLELGVSSSNIELGEKSSELQNLEARSIEDVGSTFRQLHKEVKESSNLELDEPQPEETEGGNPQHQLLKQDSVSTDLEMPVLAERSLDLTDSILDNTPEGESEKPNSLKTMHNKPVLEETDIESDEIKLSGQDPSLIETNSESGITHLCQEEAENPTFLQSVHDESALEETTKLANKDSDPTDINLEFPVLEAKSLEDIEAVLKQFREDEVQKPTVSEPIHADSTLEETLPGFAEFEVTNQDSHPTETNLELPVLEARSLEETESTLKQQVSDEEVNKPIDLDSNCEDSILEETRAGSAKLEIPSQALNPTAIDLELPVHEARSLEDPDSAFKLLREEEVKKAAVLEPIPENLPLEETKTRPAEFGVPSQDQGPTVDNLEFPVLEARSLGDIESTLKQFHEDEVQKPIVLESVDDELMMEEEARAEPSELKKSIEDPNPSESNLELPQISGENIDPSSKQICEEEAVEPIHVTSILKEIEVPSAVSSDTTANLAEVDMELPALEVRSLENIDLNTQLDGEGHQEKLDLDESVEEGHHEKPSLHESVGESHHEKLDLDESVEEGHHEKPTLDESVEEGCHEKFSPHEPVGESHHEKPPLDESVEGHHEKPDLDESVEEGRHQKFSLHESVGESHHEKPPLEELVEEGHHEKPNLDESVEEAHHEKPTLEELVEGHHEIPTLDESVEEAHHEKPTLEESVEGHHEKPSLDESVEAHHENPTLVESVEEGHESVEDAHHEKPTLDESVGNHEKPILYESVEEARHEKPTLHESIVSQSPMEIHTDSQDPETRSVGDTNLAPKHLSEDTTEDLLTPAEAEDEAVELLAKELQSEFNGDSVSQETKTHEGSSSSKADEKKKKKFGKSGSSSSSSLSSSSSSDSD